MKILYQSPNYRPETITNRYLYISHTGKAIVSETVKTEHTNYEYRKYELPASEYPRYSHAIKEAQKIKYQFPYEVEFKEDVP
ncbi:MAG: hypothetical protein E7476_07730 [Ruminococcaceae bacterium]|nr:hypothetical protein [Oscillospiraceae bacterium]